MRDINKEYSIRIEGVAPLIMAGFLDEKVIENAE